MKKATLLASVFSLSILLAACGPSTEPTDGETDDGAMIEEGQETGDDQGMEEESNDGEEEEGGEDGEARVIEIVADNGSFEPNEITVAKDENVTLEIVSNAGTHGFVVPDLGVNVSVSPGQRVSLTLPTGKAGAFEFNCSILCGSGHEDITGTIYIEE